MLGSITRRDFEKLESSCRNGQSAFDLGSAGDKRPLADLPTRSRATRAGGRYDVEPESTSRTSQVVPVVQLFACLCSGIENS
eukprot:scaffold93594_cov29-Prasinocladus_malaysianus.AAC.1